MQFCAKCGQPIADDSAFCSNCGNAVSTEQFNTPVAPATPVTPVDSTPVAADSVVESAPAFVTYESEPAQPVKKTFLQKIKALTWKGWTAIALGIIALGAGVWFLVDATTNTYETPVKLMVEDLNARSFSYDKYVDTANGFAKKELKTMVDILEDSDYGSSLEKYYEYQAKSYKSTYGDNYKYSYKIEDKNKLDKDECEEFEEDLHDAAEEILDSINAVANDDDELEYYADKMGITTSKYKKLISAIENYGKALKKAKVSEGYELTVTIILTGSKLDEPKEKEITVYVYKVDGRWVSKNALTSLPYSPF